ncbi:2-amino-3-carboxymuconate-6-semialdehyde decarboxylase like protein, partial [Aduncisulcus paluster]
IDEAGGRALPDWSPEASLETMTALNVATAILSVSTPGTTFLPAATDAAALARDLNDYTASVVADHPDRFGFFATVPLPHVDAAIAETVRALDVLHADGVVLLANNDGVYLGQDGQDDLFAALDARSAVVFIHPADLPGPAVDGVLPFAADFLLDTTRAAYLLDFAGFYFDTALSSSPAALPSLLAFADPGHVLFGSDWPFAPLPASQLFAAGLENYPLDASTRAAIDHGNALALFPRLGSAPASVPQSLAGTVRNTARRTVMRGIARLMASR